VELEAALAREISMPLKEQLAAERQRWKPLTVYQKFAMTAISKRGLNVGWQTP